MACPYCKQSSGIYGEGYGSTKKELSKEEILKIAKIAYLKGIKEFRLTGGEPLIRKDIHAIILELKKIGKDVTVTMNTNGLNLEKHKGFLCSLDNFELRVSADSYQGASNSSPKCWGPIIGKTIKEISKQIPVRIDTVVLKSNIEELPMLINYCKKNNLDLKLLDLYPPSDYDLKYWFDEFYPVGKIFEELRAKGSVHDFESDNRKGTPMKYVLLNKIRIIFKDSFLGTHLHALCKTCPTYPCQEGVYSISLSNDGRLGISHCLFPPFNIIVANEDEKFINKALDKLIRLFQESKHQKELAKHLQKAKECIEIAETANKDK